jgi:glc operon protein GlcG
MKITYALEGHDTQVMLHECSAEAARIGVAVTVAIVDQGGHVLSLFRDRARPSTVAVAIEKARTAALMRSPTSALAAKARENPALLRLRGLPIGGGVPVRFGDHVLGGIGVSGGTAEQDEQIALRGATAIPSGEVEQGPA